MRPYLVADQLKLYTLIWRRFVASFMAPAVFDGVRATIAAGNYLFVATGSSLAFDGYYAVLQREEKDTTLPPLQQDEELVFHKLDPQQHFTEPPPRYTEASLVKDLEELGIGRPSTYVPIISTIQQRKYVKLENRRFVPLELGETVNRLMKQHFPDIVDVSFTALVESGLDQVEDGEREWTELLREFYTEFKQTLSQAENDMERVERPVVEIGEACPECGSPLVIKHGRFGEFVSCSTYPECKYSRQLQKKIGVPCPRCGNDLVERKSKRGRIFYGCGTYPTCDYALWDKPVPEPCPECGGLVALTVRGKPVLRCTECQHEMAVQPKPEPAPVG